MIDRYPLTVDQMRELKSELARMLEQSDKVLNLLQAAYGDLDQRVIRAGELNAAAQRLVTELDRGEQAHRAAS